MRRREFITLIGGATAWPVAARAQQAGKLPTIGFIGSNASAWAPWRAAFAERLGQLGWIDGRNIAVEYRWSQGQPERVAEIADEFLQLKVDVIVSNDNATPTMKRATSIIPIVFVLGNDPIGSGLVTNLARPGGNVTGLSLEANDTAAKRLELLREVVPQLRRLAIISNVSNPSPEREMREIETVAHTVGLDVVPLEIRDPRDIETSFGALKADALYVVQDAVITANVMRIITYALTRRLATIFNSREWVLAGGLISYGPNFPEHFRRAAEYVDKILHGTKPGDIPVELPTKFTLVVNLVTARALGLTISPTFLARADEVIE
jgi:putative ABC transport system substrate-binding protein